MSNTYSNPYLANGFLTTEMNPLDPQQRLECMIEVQKIPKHGNKLGPGWEKINSYYKANPGLKSEERKLVVSRYNSEQKKQMYGKPFWNNGTRNIRSDVHPGEGWTRGRIKKQ